MWLETLIKILIGSSLFAIVWDKINYFIYYFIFSFKYVFAVFDFVFKILWTSSIFLYMFHMFVFAYLTYFVIWIIKKFIY